MSNNVVDTLHIHVMADTSSATRPIDDLAQSLKKLKRGLSQISLTRLSAQSGNMKNATNALSIALQKQQARFNLSSSYAKKFGATLNSIKAQTISLRSSLSRLASMFGTLYASLFFFVPLIHKIKDAIGYAADLTEIQNVVDVTFGQMKNKIEDFTKTSIRDFGMNELSAKQYASQFQSMGLAMGITGEQVKKAHEYLADFKTPTGAINGYNAMSDSLADMSINLTKLTGDLASFRDKNQSDVAQALQSGIMAGQTRPLRQYGVDLTQATLQEWALSRGIDANIASMTQAQKTMLRYEYTMERLGMAQGDYIRTSKTWANQVRLLKQQFQALGAVIGQGMIQALKPFLIAMNTALSRVIEFAKKVLNALGKIFGWKVDISAGAMDTDLEAASDAAEGLSDGLGGAADNAKELNKQLQGFDKLNNLTTNNGSSGSGSGSGSGGGASGGGSGADDITASLEKTESIFESNISTLYQLGTTIKEALMGAMDSIPWDDIYHKADNFGTGLAKFLNGLFSGTGEKNVFASLGETVAGAINTALHFLDSFGETFDFSTFGTNFASFFVEAVKNIDWTLAGKAFHDWMQGIKEAFTSFVDYLWKNKDEVWKAIKDFFSEVTIEDMAILVGVITLSKVTKWLVFGQGAATLAEGLAKALGAIAIEKIGLAIGAFELTEELTAAEMLAGVLGVSAPVLLPVAILSALSVVAWKVSEKEYEDWEDANAAVKRLVTAGIGGETLKTTVSWQILHEINTDKQGAFVNDTFGSMFTDYHQDKDGNLVYDMKGFVGLEWAKGKWQTLKEFLTEKWQDVTGGLSGEKWGEVTQAISAQMKVALEFIKDKWTTFKEWIKGKLGADDDGNVKTGVSALIGRAKDWTTTMKEWIAGKDGTFAGGTALISRLKNWKTTMKEWIAGAKGTFAGGTALISRLKNWKTTMKAWIAGVKGTFAGGTALIDRKKNWTTSLKRWLTGNDKGEFGLIAKISASKGTISAKLAAFFGLAHGGVLTASGWQPIQGYATGGMVSSAQVFMARENGLPEMVGTIGGHTAVMNNDQIVASVANGVARANESQNELLRQQNALLRQLLAKEMGITSGDIFAAVRSESERYTNRTGKAAFSY